MPRVSQLKRNSSSIKLRPLKSLLGGDNGRNGHLSNPQVLQMTVQAGFTEQPLAHKTFSVVVLLYQMVHDVGDDVIIVP